MLIDRVCLFFFKKKKKKKIKIIIIIFSFFFFFFFFFFGIGIGLIFNIAGESATQSVSRIYKHIGFVGLWNGLIVRIVMLGTLTGFQWLM